MTQPAFALTARSQLSVSPRLQQAVRLLQMSALEFEQELQQQLASNPFLEERDPGDQLSSDSVAAEITVAGAENETATGAGDPLTETALFDQADSYDGRSDSISDHLGDRMGDRIGDGAADSTSDSLRDALGDEMGDSLMGPMMDSMADSMADSMNVEATTLPAADWSEAGEFGAMAGAEPAARGNAADPDADPYQGFTSAVGLRDHLHEQLRGAQLGERPALAASLVIETLDDDGYLRDDVMATLAALDASLQLTPPLTEAEIKAAIVCVQQLEPAGVGARNLAECLKLQLQALDVGTPGRALALRLVDRQLERLARHDYLGLQRDLGCTAEALKRAHGLIRALDPRPGERYTAPRPDYVVPDILVALHKGKLKAMVNPAVLPRARLNRDCVDLLRRSQVGKYPAMQQQLQEARWLLRNAEQRHVTIHRVAEAILVRQRAFFLYGEVALKPLILREVADELGLHESTLSRATANKYMATPRGLYEFRHFFSRQLGTDTGGTCSATAVRALIKDMIETENRAEPLSDVRLARLLTESGICVARRTVAKYRNQLKLPPWELRYPG